MADGKRNVNARKLRETARRANSSLIGSHIHPSVQRGGRSMNAGSVSFASGRKQSRASHGEVRNVVSHAYRQSGAAAMHVGGRDFAYDIHRRTRARRIAGIAAILVLLAVLAVSVGVFVYFGSVGSKLALRDSDATAALKAPQEKAAYYVLISADLGGTTAASDFEGPDSLVLVRVDSQSKTMGFLGIPAETAATLSDGNLHQLRDASKEGDAALIGKVSDLVGVDIAHFVKIDRAGLLKLVDAVDGVQLDLIEEIDDPAAGSDYLPAGPQRLSGSAVLTFLRATNLSKGVQSQAQNQAAFFSQLTMKLFSAQGTLSSASLLDKVSPYFQTDIPSNDLLAAAESMVGISGSGVSAAAIPGSIGGSSSSLVSTSPRVFTPSKADWPHVQTAFVEGGDASSAAQAGEIDLSGLKVEVRNGAAVTGAAASVTQLLSQMGCEITATGNAEQQVFGETLAVYSSDHEMQAKAIVERMGFGRTVKDVGYYTYAGDVLVVIGADYKPVS